MTAGALPARGYGAHLRANGIRQHYLHHPGSGMPVVIVPGIASVAAIWGFVAARLAPAHDTYVLDVRGRGLSEAGSHLDYSLNACADDLAAFLGEAGVTGATVIGHSMGARIAIRAAARHPAEIGRLVLVDPPVSGPGRRAYPSPLPALLRLIEAARRGEALPLLRQQGAPAWPEEHVRTRAEWLHTCDPRAVAEAHASFHEDDIHADLAALGIRAALVVAGRGGVIEQADVEEIAGLMPGIAVRRLENAGHQMQVEDSEGFLSLIGRILSEQARDGRGHPKSETCKPEST